MLGDAAPPQLGKAKPASNGSGGKSRAGKGGDGTGAGETAGGEEQRRSDHAVRKPVGGGPQEEAAEVGHGVGRDDRSHGRGSQGSRPGSTRGRRARRRVRGRGGAPHRPVRADARRGAGPGAGPPRGPSPQGRAPGPPSPASPSGSSRSNERPKTSGGEAATRAHRGTEAVAAAAGSDGIERDDVGRDVGDRSPPADPIEERAAAEPSRRPLRRRAHRQRKDQT